MNVPNNDMVKKLLQESMQHSTMPLRDELWDKLASELETTPKRRKAIWFISIFSAVLVSISAALYVPTLLNNTNLHATAKNENSKTTVSSTNTKIETETNYTKVPVKTADTKISTAKKLEERHIETPFVAVVQSKATSTKKGAKFRTTLLGTESNNNKGYALKNSKLYNNEVAVTINESRGELNKIPTANPLIENKNNEVKDENTQSENVTQTANVDAVTDVVVKADIDAVVENTSELNQVSSPEKNNNKKVKNLKSSNDILPSNNLNIALRYTIGNAQMRVTNFARPATVHREFETQVEANSFLKQQVGFALQMPLPKTKQWAIGLGFNLAKFQSKSLQTYTLNYIPLRDTTFAIFDYALATNKFSIKQDKAMQISQWELPITAMYFIPMYGKSRLAVSAGANLSRTQSSGGDFINVNEFETQALNTVLQNLWDVQWLLGAQFQYPLRDKIYMGVGAQWQSTTLQSNIGYTTMRSRLQGLQYGVSLSYDINNKKN